MSLVIRDEILQSARMSAVELSQEIAVLLFQKEKLTLGQASGWSPSRCEHTHKVLILCRSLFLSIVSLERNSERDREWAEPTVLGPLRKATPQ